MAFVTCTQFKSSQDAQDERIKELQQGITVAENSGLKGKGTSDSPLDLNLGETFTVDKAGQLGINATNVANIRLVDASGKHVLGYIVGA